MGSRFKRRVARSRPRRGPSSWPVLACCAVGTALALAFLAWAIREHQRHLEQFQHRAQAYDSALDAAAARGSHPSPPAAHAARDGRR